MSVTETYVIFRKADVPDPTAANPGLTFATRHCPLCGAACWHNAARDLDALRMEIMCNRCLEDMLRATGDTAEIHEAAILDQRH